MRDQERGSALVEFALLSLVWVPLLLGTIVFGFNLLEAIQVSQLCRDSGHMFAYGVDFSQAQNATILETMASNLRISIQRDGGDGYIVFSKITLITDSDCAALPSNPCSNRNKYVFTNLVTFGNQTNNVQTSMGTPAAKFFEAGSIQIADELNDPSLVATNFSDLGISFIPGQSGQYAYISEVTLRSQSINWGSFSSTGSYARSIF